MGAAKLHIPIKSALGRSVALTHPDPVPRRKSLPACQSPTAILAASVGDSWDGSPNVGSLSLRNGALTRPDDDVAEIGDHRHCKRYYDAN